MDAVPLPLEITAYASHLCAALNEYAEDDDDLVLVPECYAEAANDLIVMRYALTHKAAAGERQLAPASLQQVAPQDLSGAFGGPELPYLKPLQSLRFYVGDQLIVAKPARYRCFTPAAAWSDADRVLADLMRPSDAVALGGAAA
jgi:hypothetical protein